MSWKNAWRAASEHIIIVTGKGKNSIEDHFDYNRRWKRFLEEKGAKIKRRGAPDQRHGAGELSRDKRALGIGGTRCWWRKIWFGDERLRYCSARVDSGRESGDETLIRSLRSDGIGAIAVEEVPKERNKFVRHRGWPGGVAATVWRKTVARTRPSGEAEAGECAFESGDYGAVCLPAAIFDLLERTSPAPEMRFS